MGIRSKTVLIDEYFKPKASYRRLNLLAYCTFALTVLMAAAGLIMGLATTSDTSYSGDASAISVGGYLVFGGFAVSIVGIVILIRVVLYDARARLFIEERMNTRFRDMRVFDTETYKKSAEEELAEDADQETPSPTDQAPEEKKKSFWDKADARMDAEEYHPEAEDDLADTTHICALAENAGIVIQPKQYEGFFVSGSTVLSVNGRERRLWMDDTEFFHSTMFQGTLFLFTPEGLLFVQRNDALDVRDADKCPDELAVLIPYNQIKEFAIKNAWFVTGFKTSKLKLKGKSLDFSKYRTLCMVCDSGTYYASLAFKGLSSGGTDLWFDRQLAALEKLCSKNGVKCSFDHLPDGLPGFPKPANVFYVGETITDTPDASFNEDTLTTLL